MNIYEILLAATMVYIYASIPFSLIIGLTKGVDIRTIGSGNIGGSNLGRACGKKAFTMSLILDGSKGMFAVLIASFIGINPLLLFGFAILGHSYSIFIKFKGGKGVATSFGFVLAFTFIEAMFAITIFLIVLKLTKFVSVSSILAMCSYTIIACIYLPLSFCLFAFIILLVAIYMHRANLIRVYNNEENKITWM